MRYHKQKKDQRNEKILGSSSKANRAISWFIDIFWFNFFQRLWKFRCEVMNEWEKKKGINIQEKKNNNNNKKRKMSKDLAEEKENNTALRTQDKVPHWLKEERILKESRDKISNWIVSGESVRWLRFKNK